MGTRSLTVFLDSEDDQELLVMYRQFDGYPHGLGAELRDFLARAKIVNGFSLTEDMSDRVYANGMGCLAAQVVAHLKRADPESQIVKSRGEYMTGNVYLYPAGTRDAGEQFIYTLYVRRKEIPSKVKGGWPKVTYTLCIRAYDVYNDLVLYDGVMARFNPDKAQEKTEAASEKRWAKQKEDSAK